MTKAKEHYQFALCVENTDSEDLEKRKVYQEKWVRAGNAENGKKRDA